MRILWLFLSAEATSNVFMFLLLILCLLSAAPAFGPILIDLLLLVKHGVHAIHLCRCNWSASGVIAGFHFIFQPADCHLTFSWR